MDDGAVTAKPSRSLMEALAAFREGDLSHTRVSRLSDLSRSDASSLAAGWLAIPEPTRAALVRRIDELSEERVDVNFRRALRVALDDPSPVVRQLAVAGLWEDESTDLLERFKRLLREDPSPDVRSQAARALERFSTKAAVGELSSVTREQLRTSLLQAASADGEAYGVQRGALEALGPYATEPEVSTVISQAFDSGDQGLRCSAIYAMGRSQQLRWLPTILTELESVEPEVRFEAARAAGVLGAADAIPLLLDAARDEDTDVRHAAIGAIGQIGGRGAIRALERLSEEAGDSDLELIESTIEDVNALVEPFQSS